MYRKIEIDNESCVRVYNECKEMYTELLKHVITRAYRLNNCQAWTIECGNYIILQSYNTFVAAYDEYSDIMYDFLRYSYGYTATSAQHIAKFRKLVEPRAFCRYIPQ